MEIEAALEKLFESIAPTLKLQELLLSLSSDNLEQTVNYLKHDFLLTNHKATSIFTKQLHLFMDIRPTMIALYCSLIKQLSQNILVHMSPFELIDLFLDKKCVILTLLDEGIITIMDIYKLIKKSNNLNMLSFFFNEIREYDPEYFGASVMNCTALHDFVISTDLKEHNKNRLNGFNTGKIETLIRENIVTEINPKLYISNSIYDDFSLFKKCTYIEYACFFGSILVLDHFFQNKKCASGSLLKFAIAGGQKSTVNYLLNLKSQKEKYFKHNKFKKIEINIDCIETAIYFHHCEIIPEKEINIFYGRKAAYLVYFCLQSHNFRFLSTFNSNNLENLDEKIHNQKKSYTVLHISIINGLNEIVKFFLSSNIIDVNSIDDEGRTPLHYSLIYNQPKITKYILKFSKQKLNINYRDSFGKTAFHYVPIVKNMKILRYFFRLDEMDPNIKDNKGNTPFHYFCKRKYFDQQIISFLANSTKIQQNALNFKDQTVLIKNVIKYNEDILQILCQSSLVDINARTEKKRETALMVSSNYFKNDSFIFLLKQKNINVNLLKMNGKTVLHQALSSNDLEKAQLLVNYPGTDFNIQDAQGIAPLTLAISNLNYRIFIQLIRNVKTNLNLLDVNGQNFFHHCVKNCFIEGVKCLACKFNVNDTDNNGTTVLHQAAAKGNIEILKILLLCEKVRINKKDKYGWTALHYACQCGSDNFVKFLIENRGKRIRINKRDKDGVFSLPININRTPFFWACRNSNIKIVEYLLKNKKVDTTIKDKFDVQFFFFFYIDPLSYLTDTEKKQFNL